MADGPQTETETGTGSTALGSRQRGTPREQTARDAKRADSEGRQERRTTDFNVATISIQLCKYCFIILGLTGNSILELKFMTERNLKFVNHRAQMRACATPPT
jgi:hypothetical protein